MAPDMWSGWGIRTLSASIRPSIRTITRPARSGRTTTPSSRLASSAMASPRKRRRSRAHQRGRQPFPAQPAAGALCRHRAAGGGLSRAVSRRQRAPGLGGRLGVRAAAGDAWLLAGRAARQALRRSALPDWLPDVTLLDLRVRAHLRHPVLARRRRHEVRGAAGRSNGWSSAADWRFSSIA